MDEAVRTRSRVDGVVQGVGFRPFVHALATRLDLSGFVANDERGVLVEVEGSRDAVERFHAALRTEAPASSVVEHVTSEETELRGDDRFEIVAELTPGRPEPLIPADSATCSDCLAEMTDPDDRRFEYPFITCANCGPRLTIAADAPYERPLTTMASFEMCSACASEFADPTDRRFHAPAVCCPECGPGLSLVTDTGEPLDEHPLEGALARLQRGEVLAIKGLGGYHLVVDATNEDAAATLRKRKHREDKPFAVMVSDVDSARRLCSVTDAEERLLSSRRAPIVLLDAREPTPVAASVAPDDRQLGVMLPHTPVHHLLLRKFPRPIALANGNVSDEPAAFTDEDARWQLSGVADAFLTHDRGIRTRTEDSVVRSLRGRQLMLRRARGHAPEPIALPQRLPRHVLACGAELNNTFCLARGSQAFVSPHIGDLENHETLRSFVTGIDHFRRLFGVTPEFVAHDLHPEYLSTRYARDLEGVDLVAVQHHHAHIASCLADNDRTGPVLGVAFDGTGFGPDGTVWGGEFLVADLDSFRRAAHLRNTPMPGATTAIEQPWRMAISHLRSCYGERIPGELDLLRRNDTLWPAVAEVAARDENTPMTSSAGCLFDAVAALLGVRDVVNYDGQATVELEQRTDPDEDASYPVTVESGPDPLPVPTTELVGAVVEDLRRGVDPGVISARFHNGLAEMIRRVCVLLRERERTDLSTVALSGSVFQNMVLLRETVTRLEADDFDVLLHHRVPPNDGGVSLGQAAVAGSQDRRRHLL